VVREFAWRTVTGLIHIGEIYLLHRNDTGWVRGVCGSVDYHKDRQIISSQHAYNSNGPQQISSSFSFEVVFIYLFRMCLMFLLVRLSEVSTYLQKAPGIDSG
jgi:hypothetical protein